MRKSLVIAAILLACGQIESAYAQNTNPFGGLIQGIGQAAQRAQQQKQLQQQQAAAEDTYTALTQQPVIDLAGKQVACDYLGSLLEQFRSNQDSFDGRPLTAYSQGTVDAVGITITKCTEEAANLPNSNVKYLNIRNSLSLARNHLTQFQNNYQAVVTMAARQQQVQEAQRQQAAAAQRQREAALQEQAQQQAAQAAEEKAAKDQAAAVAATRDATMKVDFTPQDHFQTDCLANAKSAWETNDQGSKKYSAIDLKAASNIRRNDLAVVMITGTATDDFVHKDVAIRVACTITDGAPATAKFLTDN